MPANPISTIYRKIGNSLVLQLIQTPQCDGIGELLLDGDDFFIPVSGVD